MHCHSDRVRDNQIKEGNVTVYYKLEAIGKLV